MLQVSSQSPYKLGEHSAHLTDENTLLRQINGLWGLACCVYLPTLFLCIRNSITLTLDPKSLLLGLLSPQRAHHLHHLPSPVVFTVGCLHLSTLLSPCHCWLGQATVLSHLRFHYHCHHFLLPYSAPAWPAVLHTACFPQAPSMNPPATQLHCSRPST